LPVTFPVRDTLSKTLVFESDSGGAFFLSFATAVTAAAGLGGGLGSLLRWLTGRVIGEHYHGDFPVGTFLINV
jgi:hypothetical protein